MAGFKCGVAGRACGQLPLCALRAPRALCERRVHPVECGRVRRGGPRQLAPGQAAPEEPPVMPIRRFVKAMFDANFAIVLLETDRVQQSRSRHAANETAAPAEHPVSHAAAPLKANTEMHLPFWMHAHVADVSGCCSHHKECRSGSARRQH